MTDILLQNLAIILNLLNRMPKSLGVRKIEIESGQLYNIIMDFGNCRTESIVGNGGKTKARTLDIVVDGIHISYNDLERPLDHISPLTNMLNEFILVLDGKEPDARFGLDIGLNVMKILDACQKSIDEHRSITI